MRFALAVALGAGEAENLAAVDVEGDVAEARAGKSCDPERDRRRGRCSARCGNSPSIERPTISAIEIVLGESSLDRVGAVADAVAEDGDAIGEVENLRQPVADIDDAVPSAVSRRTIAVSLATPSRSSDEVGSSRSSTFGLRDQRLDDFEELPLGGVSSPTSASGRDAEIVGGELVARPRRSSRRWHRIAGGGEQQVLRDGQFADERIVLVDRGEAEPAGEQRVGGGESRPMISTTPPSWATAPLAMPSSVLLPEPFSPRTAWISPARHSKLTSLERLDAGIALGDVGQLERRLSHPVLLLLGRQAGRRDVGARSAGATIALSSHHFANIAFSMSLSTRVDTEAPCGRSGIAHALDHLASS